MSSVANPHRNARKRSPPATRRRALELLAASRAGYVDRYCAFIDILGFQRLIAGLKGTDDQFLALREMLKKVHAPVGQPTVNRSIDFRAQSISDAVAISTLPTPEGLVRLFQVIEGLAVDLLKDGYFIRGALTKGKLYHGDTMVFGEALVRAYELENTVARYPRVMITRDVMADIDGFYKGLLMTELREQFREQVRPYIEQAADGPHFVHVLRTISANVQGGQFDGYQRLQDMIQKRLDEATDHPRHFEKVQWFALYWRKFVPYSVTGFKTITGPGMDRVEITTQ
jgi:hypothetical protein